MAAPPISDVQLAAVLNAELDKILDTGALDKYLAQANAYPSDPSIVSSGLYVGNVISKGRASEINTFDGNVYTATDTFWILFIDSQNSGFIDQIIPILDDFGNNDIFKENYWNVEYESTLDYDQRAERYTYTYILNRTEIRNRT